MLQVFATLVALIVSTAYSVAGVADPEALSRHYPLESCSIGVAGSGACDPVNLVFPGKGWEEVRDALRESGWTTAGFGSRQAMDQGLDGLVLEHEQLFFADGENTRFHIRLWQSPGLVTFGSVHHEADDLRGLTHRIDRDWDSAEAFVAEALCPAARACAVTQVHRGQHQLQGGDGEWRGWANDARLTLIVLR